MSTVVALPTLPFDTKNPCDDQGGAVCGIVRHLTDNPDTASILKSVIGVGSEILLIIIVAIIVRALLNRAISRVIDRTIDAPRLPIRPRGRRQAKAAADLDVVVETPERRHQRAETIGSVLRNTVTITVFTIAFIEILGKLGINLGPIVASAGIVGVAVGFGAQNLVKDFLSGIFMILEDQYGVGDVIDVGEATGTVEAVGLRTTRLRDVNGTVWYARNGEINRVGNKSQGWSRALLDVPIAYGADVAEARQVIKEVADSVWRDPMWAGKVLQEPEVWGVEDLGVDGVQIRLVVKTAPLAQWEVARELRQRIKAAFDEHGIEIPYKQHTIWMRTDNSQNATEPSEPVSTAKKAAARKRTTKRMPAKRPAAKKATARTRTPAKRG
ncbi:MAG: moderate conductance mechanosensitive channel [Frankiales bacterium]|nr:moderate conductance mechanosensitive channel [Frankiales bacterium]